MSGLTTLSLWRFPVGERAWAFAQMGLARPELERTRGLRFWKLLGAGRGRGFSLNPDWSRYGLLAVWGEVAAADEFFAASPLWATYRRHSDEAWTARLRPLQAHGLWSGVNPWDGAPAATGERPPGPIAVLTRATIDWRRLLAFWGAVPGTSDALDGAAGLLASIGLGEAPPLHQATFSLWRGEADLRAFAYADPCHREVIRRTRDEKWYREQLFARFVPLASEGTWNGRDPLEAT